MQDADVGVRRVCAHELYIHVLTVRVFIMEFNREFVVVSIFSFVGGGGSVWLDAVFFTAAASGWAHARSAAA